MVKLGIGGRALYVFVRAVSGLPNMEPDVNDTVKKNKTGIVRRQYKCQGMMFETLSHGPWPNK